MARLPRMIPVCAVVAAMASGATIGGGTASAHSAAPRVPKLTRLWTYRLIGPGTAPVVDGSTVVVTAVWAKELGPHARGDRSFVYAFGAACAPAPAKCPKHLLWKHGYPVPDKTGVPTGLSPAGAGDGNVYVGWNQVGASQYDGQEQAFSEATGAPVFSTGEGGTSAAVTAGGLVYVTWQLTFSTFLFTGTEALDASTGAPLFTTTVGFTDEIWPPVLVDVGPTTGPVVAAGNLFVGYGSSLDAFDATGHSLCGPPELPAPPGEFPSECSALWSAPTGATITGTPVVAGGEVYVGASNGELYAFPEAGCGATTCSPDWTATVGGSITTSVATNGATVFVGSSDGSLDAFPVGGCGSSTCAPEWSAPVGGALSAPAVNGSLVYVGSTSGLLDAFPATGCGHPTCTAQWQANVRRAVSMVTAAGDGVIFVTDVRHNLDAYRVP